VLSRLTPVYGKHYSHQRLSEIIDLGTIHFFLFNNRTGEKVKVDEWNAGGFMDGYELLRSLGARQ
jgi:hypothetical protein